MKKSNFFFIIAISLLSFTLFACKKESIVTNEGATKLSAKKYFYLEEISISGDTTKSAVILTN